MKFESKYGLLQTVYLVHDPEQIPRMIVQISFGPNNVFYALSCGGEATEHYEQEISDEVNELISMGIITKSKEK